MKRIIAILIIILIVSSGCYAKPEVDIEMYSIDSQNFEIVLDDGDNYITCDNNGWYPNLTINGIENAIGYCERGYVFETSSNNCMYVAMLRGDVGYYVYKEGFEFSDMASDAIIVAYADEGFSSENRGPSIDISHCSEELMDIIKNENVHETMDREDIRKKIIGSISFRNSIDDGLFKSYSLYNYDDIYYVRVGKLYCNVTEFMPDNIGIIDEYKDQNY